MTGRVFLFGEDVDTDALAPGAYMKGPIEELARHCLESLRPDFAAQAAPGDILVAGRNFGMGSSREQAAQALKALGIAAVVARSFAGIFHRNAINLGLPVLVAPDLEGVEDGDRAELDLEGAWLQLSDKERTIGLEPLPDFLRALLADGGLVPHLKKRLHADKGMMR